MDIFKNAGSKVAHGIYELTHPDKKRVYYFSEGSVAERSLLGNKGANLCEMYRLKLPIPIGFVITTESCIDFTRETKEKGVSELNPHLSNSTSALFMRWRSKQAKLSD